MLNNASILITGGTGSFGREFLTQILKKYSPRRVIIFSRDEHKQFAMNSKFSTKKYKCLRYFIGDVRDIQRLKIAMEGVDYVVHAAALKHVAIAEYNPTECIQTNIIGAQNIIESALYNKVKKVIAISSDKAANPINLYGATKLASDKLFIAANNFSGRNPTRFSVVRYGNVLNSRGSVVPMFKRLLKEKSKFIPVTDDKMTRFWITLEQTSRFVLTCLSKMVGGETFIPKIPTIKIVDLARAIAPNLKIKIIGIRPGEKLHEILCPVDSAHLTYAYKDYYVMEPDIVMFYRKKKKIDKGKKVGKDFEYSSNTNKNVLSVKDIKRII